MAIPKVSLTIKDGALGLAGPNTNGTQLKIGTSSLGTVRTIYSFSDLQTLNDTLGEGPLVEAAALVLAVAGGPVLCMPATQTTPGSSGAVTKVGTGTAVMSVSVGVAFDSYAAIVKIITGAANLAAAAAQIQVSLDGGLTYGPTVALPVSGIYPIPKSGLQVTFVDGTFVAGDTYSFASTAPAYSSGELTTCITAALADPRTWFLLHAVGPASSAAGAASLVASLETQLNSAAANQFRYACGLVEVPSDTDANIITAFNAASALRVGAGAGFASTTSPINSRQMSRSAAWDVAARASLADPSEHLGRVASNSLPGITAISRDERVTEALDAARFCTLRTHVKRNGFYITNDRLMAPPGSDFIYMRNRRVMDIACTEAYSVLLNRLNTTVRVDSGGKIFEKDARTIEREVMAALETALLQPLTKDGQGYASAVTVVIDRIHNITSDGTLPVTIRVQPLGYAQFITVLIGFTNPALQLLAA